jgi:two-component system, LuxR family, sensor kinase FixL
MARPIMTAVASVEALAEVVPDALVLVDTHGSIVLVNSLTEGLFGYQRDELVGQGVEILVPERYRASQASHLAAFLADPRPRPMDRRLDIVGRRKDASEFPADITLRPLQTQQELLVVAAIRDITERKQLEDERTMLLERERAARLEAEAAVRVRDAFLAAASHDLKNPLMAIKLRAEMLEELSWELSPPDAAEQVRTSAAGIVASSGRVVAMLRQLLDVAQLQMGQQLVLERTPTDLVGLARRAVDEHAQASPRHMLRLRGQKRGLVGQWDAGRLERLLDNLLDNAIKYSPKGGEVTVSLARDDTWAVLAVTDKGVGIPASDLPHILEWFHRASNVASTAQGVGIGLAVVRQIVEQHGGTVAVASCEGEGSTFTVRLPLVGH